MDDLPVEVLFKVYDLLPIDDIVLRIISISTTHLFAVRQWLHLRVIKSFLQNDSFLTIDMLRGGTGSTQSATVQTASNNGTTIHLSPIHHPPSILQNDLIIHDIAFCTLDIGFIGAQWDTAVIVPNKNPPQAYNAIKVNMQRGRKLEMESPAQYHGRPLAMTVFRQTVPIYFFFDRDPIHTPQEHWTLMKMEIFTRDLFQFSVNWR